MTNGRAHPADGVVGVDDGGGPVAEQGPSPDVTRPGTAPESLRRGIHERLDMAEPTAAPPASPAEPPSVDDLRARLGLRPLFERPHRTARLWGWLGPVLVAALAAVLRLVGLTHPDRLIFDETYYVKEAFSFLTLGYEGEWTSDDASKHFAAGDYSDLSTIADYVVHPAVGKWMIAAGIHLFGADNGAGWRVAGAVVGALTVLLVSRIALRLTGSVLLATTAGLFLALDGIHLTMSRIGLLDVFLAFWVLVGFWAVLRDREATRSALASRVAAAPTGRLDGALGPRTGVRWWLVVAGVALGLACGVKWSGAYAVAVLGLLVLAWDLAARRAVGARWWHVGGVLRGGLPAFVALVPTAALTYVATWFSWFLTPGAYRRTWAEDLRESGEPVPRGWLPDLLNSWWEYHLVMWDFHTNLTSDHSYMSNPAGWLLQLRPTLMYRPDPPPPPEACGAEQCTEVIHALGNPAVWWFAAAALLLLIYLAVRGSDWRAWAILAGYVAMYVPWLAYSERTIFTFYTVAFVPYVVLCLTLALGWVMGVVRTPGLTPLLPVRARHAHLQGESRPADGGHELADDDAPADQRPARTSMLQRLAPLVGGSPGRAGWIVYGAVVLLVVACAVFFWPVWTGETISRDAWLLRMWLPEWP